MSTPAPDQVLDCLQDARRRSGRILLRGATVVTLDPGVPAFVGDVLIAGDRVEDLGASISPVGPDVLTVDLGGRILVPGLVDSHVHAWLGQLRGAAPRADLGAYMDLFHGRVAPRCTPEDIALGQRLTAAHALNGGVTTIVDNSNNVRSRDHAVAGVEALRDSGVRAVHAMSAPRAGEHDGWQVDDLVRLRDELAADAEGRVTLRLFDLLTDAQGSLTSWRSAAEHGFGVCAELGGWVPDLPSLLASGLMGPSHTFNHCTGLDEETWQAIGDSGAAVNLALRSDAQYGLGGFSPVLQAQRHVVQHGISSDNETAYGLDLFAEMRALLLVQNCLAQGAQTSGAPAPERYAAGDALRAATVGGALNAGLGHAVGRIARGMKADLVAISLRHPTTDPKGGPQDAETTVVQFAGIGDVEAVFVDGVVRKWGDELVGTDHDALVRDAEGSRERLLG